MKNGGIYEPECTEIRERLKATGVILIVINGARGGGFEVQAPGPDLFRLPETLRYMADEIERDIVRTVRDAIEP